MSEPLDNRGIRPLSGIRAVLELAAVVVLVLVGSILGSLTHQLALASILGMALPLIAATVFLYRQGLGWRDLGFGRRMPFWRFLRLAVGTALLALFLSSFVLGPVLRSLGAPPANPEVIVRAIEGNTTAYLLFLFPVTWGSAAFGEELLVRGFMFHRFAALAGTRWGLVLQAALFALGHTYQGYTGVINLFVVGLVFGWGYLRAERNLWPVIVAHGLIDTLSITLVYLGYAQQA